MRARQLGAWAAAALLLGCGGGTVENTGTTGGEKLSFLYFQKCVNPVFLKALKITQNGVVSTNSCASGGCHAPTGTGGALRLVPGAQEVDLADAANTADVVRTTDMYKNFYSAQGATVIGSAGESRLLNKPLVNGVLHGGGLVFESADDANAKLLAYWVNHPVPEGQDEFGSAGNNLFTPPDAQTGSCNTQ